MPYKVVNIAAKLARHKTKRPSHLPEANLVNVMVHHSGAENDIYADVRWHVEGRDWWGSAYYKSFDYDGTVYVCRKRTERGNHCGGGNMNGTAVAYCVRGNMDNHPPTEDQILSVVEQIILEERELGRRLKFKWHGDYVATSCPGAKFPKQRIVDLVADHYAPPPPPAPEPEPEPEIPAPKPEPETPTEPDPIPPPEDVVKIPAGCLGFNFLF